MPQTFNETFLGNADVPATGSTSGAGRPANYDTRKAATGMPAVQSFDPAANLRTNAVTKQAAMPPSTPSGTAKFKPSAVRSFVDGRV